MPTRDVSPTCCHCPSLEISRLLNHPLFLPSQCPPPHPHTSSWCFGWQNTHRGGHSWGWTTPHLPPESDKEGGLKLIPGDSRAFSSTSREAFTAYTLTHASFEMQTEGVCWATRRQPVFFFSPELGCLYLWKVNICEAMTIKIFIIKTFIKWLLMSWKILQILEIGKRDLWVSSQWSTVLCLVAQLCQTLCDPMDRSPPYSSVHGTLQAGILEWVAIPSSRGSSQPRDQSQVSCIADRFFTSWATRKAPVKC